MPRPLDVHFGEVLGQLTVQATLLRAQLEQCQEELAACQKELAAERAKNAGVSTPSDETKQAA